MSDRDKMYGDAVYEAWRSGRNPDAVDYDRMDDDYYRGYEPEQCIEHEIRRITPCHEPKENDE